MDKGFRLTAFILAFCVVFSLLSSCRGNGSLQANAVHTTAAAPVEKTTIRVASTFTGDDPYTPVWQKVLTDFQREYPNIKIIDEATAAAGDSFKIKINTDFASGNEPDVTYGFNGATGKLIVDSGKVICWEDELKADPKWAANFYPDPLESSKWNGKLYCLPYLGYYEGMWVNTDLFYNNGLEIPKTYDDIVKSIPVFKEKGIAPIAAAFSDEPHYIIETFLLSMGGSKGHSNPFDPSWAKALQLIKDLYDKGAFTDDALTIKQASCVELFADKKAAMLISGSWSKGKFPDSENTVVIPLPLVPGGAADPTDIIGGAGSGWYLVKALNDQKNGAGMKFIKYMTQPEVVAKFVQTAGVPSIKVDVQARNTMDLSGIKLMDNANSINGAIGDVLGQEVFGSIWHGLFFILTGEKTPEQVLGEAEKLYGK